MRFRPMIIPSVLEKFSYGASLIVLYLQNRLRPTDLLFGGVDLLFGALFVAAFFGTAG